MIIVPELVAAGHAQESAPSMAILPDLAPDGGPARPGDVEIECDGQYHDDHDASNSDGGADDL